MVALLAPLVAAAGVAAGVAIGAGAAPGDATLYVWPSPVGAVRMTPPGTDPNTSTALESCEDTDNDPSGFDGCTLLYAAGTPVTLDIVTTANAFHHWSIGECGTSPHCVVTLPEAGAKVSALAFFDPARLKVLATGTGTVTGSGFQCTAEGDENTSGTCEASFTPGQPVTLTASSPNGWQWKFGCFPAGGDPSAATCVAQPENFFVGIRFNDADPNDQGPFLPFGVQVDFRVSRTGSGSGKVSGGGLDCGSSCLRHFDFGQPVTLTASADAGSKFDHWVGVCGTSSTCSFTAGPITAVRAVFEAVPGTTTKAPTTATTTSASTTASTTMTKPPKLRGRITKVVVGARRPYRVNVWIQSSKPARARLRVVRKQARFLDRTVSVRAGLTMVASALPKRTTKGSATLTVVLRDRDGQVLSLRRVIALGH